MPSTSSDNAIPVIAIDGPSGSGKGTIARLVAERLGFHLLDSGALYRLLGLAAQRRGVALDDEDGLSTLAAALDAGFDTVGDEQVIYLDKQEVTDQIRSETAGDVASQVARLPRVREALLQRQRDFRRPPGLVADGRDMGSVVFADAPVKIFLTASADERARRRYKQLKQKGLSVSLSALSREIAERDRRDASRAVAPLRPAADAALVDTTGIGIEAVVDRVMDVIRERLPRLEARHLGGK